MRGGGGIDRARTFSGGDLVGDGGQVLRQMVVQLGGETCALICLHLRFRLRDLAAVYFASAPFGEDAERRVPDEDRHEQQQQHADHDHQLEGRPPRRVGENGDIGWSAQGDEYPACKRKDRVPVPCLRIDDADASDGYRASDFKSVGCRWCAAAVHGD